MAKILVTGCTGLLGANVCHTLRTEHSIVGLSRAPFSMQGVEYIRCDFTDSKAMTAVLETSHFDAVIHCAAMTNVDECERNPTAAMDVNCNAAVALGDLANSTGAKFVFISSDAVFSGDGNRPYSENDPIGPQNVYGESKAKAEEMLALLENVAVVRTNMYGFNWLPKNSFSEWIVNSLNDGATLRMFTDVQFSALLVNDLAVLLEEIIKKDLTGVLHVASADSMSKYEFGRALADALGIQANIIPVSVDDFSFEAKRSHNMALDSSCVARQLGHELPTMAQGIDRCVELYKSDFQGKLRSA